MPKPRIDEPRAKIISRKLNRYAKLKGGKIKVQRATGISDMVFYRALNAACIEVEKAERLEKFFETDKI